jgi:hypothetical protein
MNIYLFVFLSEIKSGLSGSGCLFSSQISNGKPRAYEGELGKGYTTARLH